MHSFLYGSSVTFRFSAHVLFCVSLLVLILSTLLLGAPATPTTVVDIGADLTPTTTSTPTVTPLPITNALTLEPVDSIGGRARAVVVADDYAYLGEGLGFTILDVSHPGSVAQRARLLLPGYVRDIQVVADRAYVALGNSFSFGPSLGQKEGLCIIDVRNPAAPRILGTYLFRDANAPLSEVNRVAVAGTTAYLSAIYGGVLILDVRTPTMPTLLGRYRTDAIVDMHVVGNLVYLAMLGDIPLIVDVINPANPLLVSGFPDVETYNAIDLQVVGELLFATSSSGGVYIYDISTLSRPQRLGSIQVGSARSLQVSGNLVYVLDDEGLQILDASDPATLVHLGSYGIETWGEETYDLAVVNGRAYIASADAGLLIIDTQDTHQPTLLGRSHLPASISHLTVGTERAIVADDATGLIQIIDVTDPTHLRALGSYTVTYGIRSLQTNDDLALVATWHNELEVLDLHQPLTPTLASVYIPGSEILHLELAGNLAFVAAGTDGLHILNMSYPLSPTLVGRYDTMGKTIQVQVVENRAYLQDQKVDSTEPEAWYMLDVSNPANPQLLARYDYAMTPWPSLVDGTRAYVWNGGTLTIVDASDPTNLAVLGRYIPGVDSTPSFTVANNRLYLKVNEATVQVLNVSDPSHMVVEGTYEPGFAGIGAVQVVDDLVYLAAYEGGLNVLRVRDDVRPTVTPTPTHTPTPAPTTCNPWSPCPPAFTFEPVGHITVTMSSLVVSGTFAYAGSDNLFEQTGTVQVIDVRDPARLVVHGSYTTTGVVRAMQVSGTHLYVAANTGGLQIVDVHNPDRPTLLGTYPLSSALDVSVSGPWAYVAAGREGLQIVDVHDPTHPVLVSSYVLSDTITTNVQTVHNRVYVASDGYFFYHLAVLDASTPAHPTLLGEYQAAGGAGALQVDGNRVYVLLDIDDGLRMLDVSNPATPHLVGWYTPDEDVFDTYAMHVVGSRAYLGGFHTMSAVDMRDPTNPQVLAAYSLGPWSGQTLQVVGDLVYGGGSNQGLFVLRIREAAMGTPTPTPGATGTATPTWTPGTTATAIPTPTATGTAGTPPTATATPTDTPLATPTTVITSQLTINYTTGKPGSYFTVTGSSFPSGKAATVSVNGWQAGTVTTDATGSFRIILRTMSLSQPGLYTVVVTAAQTGLHTVDDPQASISYTLDLTAPQRPREAAGESPLLVISSHVLPSDWEPLYLPLVQR